ncbi:TorD/DmsD family molecular chaperone [Infirmifilum sp. SLHALR2]
MLEVRLFQERGLVYKVLSLAFHTPSDSGAVDELVKLLPLLRSVQELRLDAGTLELFTGSWIEALSIPREGLLVEYTRLFVNDCPHLACPPYETYWRDGERTIYGSGYSSLLEIYRTAGLEPSPIARQPIEHVALELELMHYLVLRSLEDESFLCLQERLFKDHISVWAEPYASCLESHALLENYRASARLLREVAELEEMFFATRNFCR